MITMRYHEQLHETSSCAAWVVPLPGALGGALFEPPFQPGPSRRSPRTESPFSSGNSPNCWCSSYQTSGAAAVYLHQLQLSPVNFALAREIAPLYLASAHAQLLWQYLMISSNGASMKSIRYCHDACLLFAYFFSIIFTSLCMMSLVCPKSVHPSSRRKNQVGHCPIIASQQRLAFDMCSS